MQQLLEEANQTLYNAKEAVRNSVRKFETLSDF